MFPPNFLFVDSTSILLDSRKNVQNKSSLPKIYSVDSFNENSIKEPIVGKRLLDQKHNNNEFNMEIENSTSVEKVEETLSTKSITEEDLFSEKNNKNENQTYSICLQEKMSSLLDMLQSSEPIQGEEDIFEETPLKIERSDFSYSQAHQNSNHLKSNTCKKSVAINLYSLDTSDNIPCNNSDCNFYKNKIPSERKNKEKNYCITQSKVKNNIPFYFGKSKEDNNDKSIPQTEKVIYDKRSVIKLFHTKEANQGLNTGSTPGELSTFSSWPVTAEYIQVSKRNSPQKCQSVSSDNSIPLSKSFGKSYYSLHLNKKYEQKQFYDGDLLVLDNQERSLQQASSSCTFLNQPYSFFSCEENYKKYEKINYTQNVLDGKINDKLQLFQNKNLQSGFKKVKNLNSKRKNLKDVKKTLAVHYKDCGDSLKATDKSFHRENFDFLKVNGFDDNKNWNSFISIFTSKVGPAAQINHHRMFRRVINTFATDSLACKNVYRNVHTLTSNGGPFRLFDINGYPMTDSAGNVLKDPYGKSVVTLDSTGFPKDDIKVFDAAGNSFNDVNFDPTQKPKTNSIIIKLTDNFKRPLHLFDKYGRPLTDSCGKLLVNIHGRPLLRFDNFGRPNTDYRGGPLYTDNGYRWSHKTDDSLSSNKLSCESLMPKTLYECLESDSRQNSFENFCLKDKNGDKSVSNFENIESKHTDDRNCSILNPTESDIWIKLENVLQTFPKNKKIEPKVSQTSVIVNNVTVTQNPIEREFLKSIIYHNNIIQQDVNHFNKINSQPFTNHKTFLDFKNINRYPHPVRKNPADESRKYCVGKLLHTDGYKPSSATPLPFQNSIYVQNTYPNRLNFDRPKYIYSNKFLNDKTFSLENAFTYDAGDMLKNQIATTLSSYPKSGIKRKSSYFTFKKNDYLNDLCNKIIKHEINYLEKNKHHIDPKDFKKTDWTETSNTEFLSSIGSKYTTGLATQTESPVYLSEVSKNHSQDTNLQNNYYKSYLTEQKPLDYLKKERDVLNKGKYCSQHYQIKSETDFECVKQRSSYSSNEPVKERFHKESALSLPKSNKDTVSIKVHNKDNKHYEIKVTEMLSKIINPNLSFGLFNTKKLKKDKSNSFHTYPKLEIESTSKNTLEISTNKLIEKQYTIKDNYKEQTNNSLFRFSSDEVIETAPKSERNIKASCSQRALYTSESNVYKNSFKVHHEGTKHLTDKAKETLTNDRVYKNEISHTGLPIKPLMQSQKPRKEPTIHKKDRVYKNDSKNRTNTYPVKKPCSSNRECNLATFFGSPVRYVLNKLDGKRSFKPNKTNTFVKKKTLIKSKENLKQSHDATNFKDQIKNDIKTLYDITKSSKKNMLSSSEKAEIRNYKDKPIGNEQDTLLAFPSKSCTGLISQEKNVLMSYSGDSQSANRKRLLQGFNLSSNKLQKSMSASSCITVERSRNKDSVRHGTKYDKIKEIHKKSGQHYLKPSMIQGKYTKIDNNTQKSSKSRKGSSGRHSKSPTKSSGTKAKEISLFKKVEPEGKYMLKIKR